MKLSEVFKAIEDDKRLEVKFKNKKIFEELSMSLLKELSFNELEECEFRYAPIIINNHALYPEHKPLDENDDYYIPCFGDMDDMYEHFEWESDSELCQFHLKHNLVYLQSYDAERHAKALLNIKD